MKLKLHSKAPGIRAFLPSKILLVMKLSVAIIIISCLQVSAKGYAQMINLSEKNAPLAKVFSIIHQQSGYNFFYNDKLIKDVKVSVELANADIEHALNAVLQNQQLSFSIINKTIVLKKKEKTTTQTKVADAPPAVIKGKVLDENGKTLIGASVKIKGTTVGVITNVDGAFSINAPDNATLVVSYIGYETQEIHLSGQLNIDIKLVPAQTNLNQVVVVGYGTQKKSDLTGSVATVDLKRTENSPNTNLGETLQGSIPGLNVTPNGVPGSGGTISIRGQRSISANNAALIVMDGVVLNQSLADINPADIADVSILKDVSSTAIYGSRGANGVILITSKQGKTEKPTINYSMQYGKSDYARVLPLLDRNGYLQKVLDYQYDLISNGTAPQGPTPINASNPSLYLQSPSEVAGYNNGTNVNWNNVIKQAAPQSVYNLSIGGKTPNTTYFISGNYTNQKGVIIGSNFKRLSFRSNLETTVTPWLKVGMTSFYERMDQSGIPSTMVGPLSLVSPLVGPRDAAGNLIEYPMDADLGIVNPLENSLASNLNQSYNLTGSFFANLQIPFIKGLNYKITFTNTFFNNENYTFWTPDTYAGGRGLNGTGSKQLGDNADQWLDNILTYKKSFQKHAFDVTLLYTANQYHSETSSLSASNFPNTTLGYNGLSLGATQTVGQSAGSSALVGSMARLNYSYDGRYLVTATVRRDGYSAFGANNKYAIFPSFALGWIVSEENFLKNVTWIDFLKLRYSYGASGNQGISAYSSLAKVSSDAYVFGDGASQTLGQYVSTLANTTLGWETTLGSNYGIDLHILKSRIELTVDYYHYYTKNLLLTRALPSETGFGSVLSNIGGTANKGLEIGINSVNIKSGNFEWSSNFNFSANRNQITHLYGTIDPATGKEANDISNRWFIGQPVSTIYDYVFNGIYQTGQPTLPGNAGKAGYISVADLNGDGKIDGNDRKILGTGNPDFRAGLNNNFRYKDFTLSVFANTVYGGMANNPILEPNANFAYRTNYLNIGWWTPTNQSNTRPSLASSNLTGVGLYQSKTVTRIQDISLTYSIPKRILKPLNVNSLSVFASAKNPFMFTKWTGYDPEIGTGGIPNYKTFVFGLNLSF
ncbi:MAG: TonB-dependent receptor [Mucilaginibacter sp.]